MDPITFELPIARAWGVFNDAHTQETYEHHAPPYIIRPFPDRLFKSVGDNQLMYRSLVFDNYWRFDLLRPLYGGRADYFNEFLYLTTSPIIILDIFKVAYKLLTEAYYHAKHMIPVIIFLTIPALIYTTIITALSMLLSLLGLIIRPLITLLLGTNDPDLKIKYECDFNHIYDKNGTLYADVTYTFIKGDHPTRYKGTVEWKLPLNLPQDACYSNSNPKVIWRCEGDYLHWNITWENHKFENNEPISYPKSATGQDTRNWFEKCLRRQMENRIQSLAGDERKAARHERSFRLFDKGSEMHMEYKNYVQASERTWRR